MRLAPMFEEKNSLPGAKLHFAIDDRNGLARPREHHANVRWHIVWTFVVVFVIRVFRHELVEKFLDIAARGRRGVLHRGQTATGVLNKNRDRAMAHFALVDLALNFLRDFVGALAFCCDGKMASLNAHSEATVRGGTT